MRIAHVLDSLEVGGAESVASALARLHAGEGHEVSVHGLFGGGPLTAELRSAGIAVRIHGPNSIWRVARSLYASLQEFKPEAVHCHNAAATILAAPVARMAGIKAVISTRHGLVARPYAVRQELKFSLVTWLFCRRVVAVCAAAQRNLAAAPAARAGKIIVIRNGALPAPASHLDAAPASANGFTLINVARLAREKDQATLLRAVAIAAKQIPDLMLWVLGGGTRLNELRSLADQLGVMDHVLFLGETKNVGDYLSRAHLFVLSSITEGLPISLLEAMAAGLPAIVTDAGGMAEVLGLSGAGAVVRPGDAMRMAETIVEYAQHRSLLVELGARARRSYERYFTPERMANAYRDVYQEVAAQ